MFVPGAVFDAGAPNAPPLFAGFAPKRLLPACEPPKREEPVMAGGWVLEPKSPPPVFVFVPAPPPKSPPPVFVFVLDPPLKRPPVVFVVPPPKRPPPVPVPPAFVLMPAAFPNCELFCAV